MRWRKRENAYEMEEERELVKQRMRKSGGGKTYMMARCVP